MEFLKYGKDKIIYTINECYIHSGFVKDAYIWLGGSSETSKVQ